MKYMISVLLLTVLPAISWARGGETQNGAGAAEQNFAYALTLLKPLYQQCLATESCLRMPAQKAILQTIYENMDEDLKNGSPLRFIPGDPKKFKIDGQIRIAYTDIKVGSLIFINQDLIYSQKNGKVIPYTVSEAIAVLTHEFGHHVPVLGNHEFLDSVGANVRAFFEQERQIITREKFLDNLSSDTIISLSALHSVNENQDESTKVWLNVDDQIFNIDKEIQRQLHCVGHKDVKDITVTGARFFNLHWGESQKNLGNSRYEIAVAGQALISCEGANLHGYSGR